MPSCQPSAIRSIARALISATSPGVDVNARSREHSAERGRRSHDQGASSVGRLPSRGKGSAAYECRRHSIQRRACLIPRYRYPTPRVIRSPPTLLLFDRSRARCEASRSRCEFRRRQALPRRRSTGDQAPRTVRRPERVWHRSSGRLNRGTNRGKALQRCGLDHFCDPKPVEIAQKKPLRSRYGGFETRFPLRVLQVFSRGIENRPCEACPIPCPRQFRRRADPSVDSGTPNQTES